MTRDTKIIAGGDTASIRQAISVFNTLINKLFNEHLRHSSIWHGACFSPCCGRHAAPQAQRNSAGYHLQRGASHEICPPRFARSLVSFRKRYGNHIGGNSSNRYPATTTQHLAGDRPADRRIPAFRRQDIELALDAAHAAAGRPGKPACRSAPTCCWRSPIASKRGWRCWR